MADGSPFEFVTFANLDNPSSVRLPVSVAREIVTSHLGYVDFDRLQSLSPMEDLSVSVANLPPPAIGDLGSRVAYYNEDLIARGKALGLTDEEVEGVLNEAPSIETPTDVATAITELGRRGGAAIKSIDLSTDAWLKIEWPIELKIPNVPYNEHEAKRKLGENITSATRQIKRLALQREPDATEAVAFVNGKVDQLSPSNRYREFFDLLAVRDPEDSLDGTQVLADINDRYDVPPGRWFELLGQGGTGGETGSEAGGEVADIRLGLDPEDRQALGASAAGIVKALEQVNKFGSAAADTELSLDGLYQARLTASFLPAVSVPDIDALQANRLVVEQFNREVNGALADKANAAIGSANEIALAVADERQSEHEAGVTLGQAEFLNDRHRSLNDTREAAGRELFSATIGGGAMRYDEFVTAQRRKIDVILADPSRADLTPSQVELLAGLTDDQLGLGERRTFVVTDGDGYTVHFGDEVASLPVPLAELEALAARIGDTAVVPRVVLDEAVPLTAVEIVGKDPNEVKRLLDERFESSTGRKADGRFGQVPGALRNLAVYNGTVYAEALVEKTVGDQLTGRAFPSADRDLARMVVTKTGRKEVLDLAEYHPDIAAAIGTGGGKALDAAQRAVLADEFPVLYVTLFDQIKLEDGTVVSDIALYIEHGEKQRGEVFGRLIGAPTLDRKALHALNADIDRHVTDTPSAFGNLSATLFDDFPYGLQVLARESLGVHNNERVRENEQLLAQTRGSSDAQAELNQDIAENEVAALPYGATFETADGEKIDAVYVADRTQLQRTIELSTKEKERRLDAANNSVVVLPNERKIRVGDLHDQNDVPGAFQIGLSLDPDGSMQVPPQVLHRLADEAEQPTGEPGEVGVELTPTVPAESLPPDEKDVTPGIGKVIQDGELNRYLQSRQLEVSRLTANMPAADRVKAHAGINRIYWDVVKDPALQAAVLAQANGEPVDSDYADHPALRPIVDENGAIDDEALDLAPDSLESFSREKVDDAIDTLYNGDAFSPGPFNRWNSNETLKQFDLDVPAAPAFLNGIDWRDKLSLRSVDRFITPGAHAQTTPSSGGNSDETTAIDLGAGLSLRMTNAAIDDNRTNNVTKLLRESVDGELARERFTDSVYHNIDQQERYRFQLEQLDALLVERDNLESRKFDIDDSVRFESVRQAIEQTTLSIDQTVVDNVTLTSMVQSLDQAGALDDQLALLDGIPIVGTDTTYGARVREMYGDGRVPPPGRDMPVVINGQVFSSREFAESLKSGLEALREPQPPSVRAQEGVPAVGTPPLDTSDDNRAEPLSASAEHDRYQLVEDVVHSVGESIVPQVSPRQEAVIAKFLHDDVEYILAHAESEKAVDAFVALRAEDGTFEGETFDEHVAKLPLELERRVRKYGRRIAVASDFGLKGKPNADLDAQKFAANTQWAGSSLGATWLRRQQLWTGANDFRKSLEIGDRLTDINAGVVANDQARNLVSLLDDGGEVSLSYNERSLADYRRDSAALVEKLARYDNARGGFDAQLSAWNSRNQAFTTQLADHADLVDLATSDPALYVEIVNRMVDEGELDERHRVPDGVLDLDRDEVVRFAVEPILDPASGITLYPENYRARVLGEPPALAGIETGEPGGSSEPPELFAPPVAIEMIEPDDPAASVANIRAWFKENGILFPGLDERETEAALQQIADDTMQNIALASIDRKVARLGEEMQWPGERINATPSQTDPITGVRYKTFFDETAADRAALAAYPDEVTKELHRAFAHEAAGDTARARQILSDMSQDHQDRWLPYLGEMNLVDFVNRQGHPQDPSTLRP